MEDAASVGVGISAGTAQTELAGTTTRGLGVVCSMGKASIADQGGRQCPKQRTGLYTLI